MKIINRFSYHILQNVADTMPKLPPVRIANDNMNNSFRKT